MFTLVCIFITVSWLPLFLWGRFCGYHAGVRDTKAAFAKKKGDMIRAAYKLGYLKAKSESSSV